MDHIKTAVKRYPWITMALLLVVGLFGYRQLSSWSETKSEARNGRRTGGGNQIPVVVARVSQKSMPVEVRAIGNVEAYSTVSVRAQVTGVIMRVHFKEGQDVKKGDLLFTVDPRPFQAALKQAEANLAKDQAQLENARQDARRYAELIKKQLVAQQQYDLVRTNAAALEAAVNADQAAMENAKVQLSYCYIYSPVTGRTGSLLVNEGNLVRTNDASALVVINQISPIYVSFTLPEQYLSEIKGRLAAGGLRVAAVAPGQAQESGEGGDLTFVDNAVDKTTGTIRMKATFTNNSRRLWPGQFVNVAVTLSSQPDAIAIPSQAVQAGQEGQLVFVVKPDLTVEARRVVVSRTVNNEAVIESGLRPGEIVVTDGQFQLAPGVRVEVKKAGREAES